MKSVQIDDILLFHNKIIDKTGGSKGVGDITLVESALNRAFVTYDGNELYVDMFDKISVITYSLINNHGFVDGNKRIGIAVMLLLLQINEVKVHFTQRELIELGLITASGQNKEADIKNWIKEHMVNKA